MTSTVKTWKDYQGLYHITIKDALEKMTKAVEAGEEILAYGRCSYSMDGRTCIIGSVLPESVKKTLAEGSYSCPHSGVLKKMNHCQFWTLNRHGVITAEVTPPVAPNLCLGHPDSYSTFTDDLRMLQSSFDDDYKASFLEKFNLFKTKWSAYVESN